MKIGKLANKTSPIPFSIRIGVTGHRKIDNPDTVAEQVRQQLKNHFPELGDKISFHQNESNSAVPILYIVVTSLAEGADRIVAKEVLKLDGSRIEVILPLCKEDYLNDFRDNNSKNEFEQLLGEDPPPKILRARDLREQFPSYNYTQLLEERNKAYLEAGEYIVDHCNVLIAIWDGENAKGKGGTGDIVAYARKKDRPMVIIPIDKR